MNDAPASVFGQINVDNEEVVYMQSDMSLSNDSFTATVSNQHVIQKNLQFNVKVVPLVRRQVPFKVTETKTQLNQKNLDASHLAGLTNSNPIYFLIDTPEFSKVMRIVKASSFNEITTDRERQVWQFTHEDVKNGVIYIVVNTETSDKNDSFTYRLEAPGVQPALGSFDFTIMKNSELATKTVSNPITEDVTGMNNNNKEESVNSQVVIGISAIFVLLLVLIIVVFVIRLKRARDAQRSKCTAPNNTKLNGDTTMTTVGSTNPYGTIQRCGSTMRRPINNGFATLEQHPHNTLRYSVLG